jgi:hypothetical protein
MRCGMHVLSQLDARGRGVGVNVGTGWLSRL